MMRMIGSILVALVVFGSFSVRGQGPEKPRREFLSTLKEGQAVMVKEAAGRFEISQMDDFAGSLGHKVTDVGQDYVTVVDIAGVTETRIPVYSIKAVVRLKVPKKP